MSRTRTNTPAANLGAVRLFKEIKSLETHSRIPRSDFKLVVLDLVFLKYLSGDKWPRLWEKVNLYDGKEEIDLREIISQAFDVVQSLCDHSNLNDFKPRQDNYPESINKIVLYRLIKLLSDGSFHRLFGDMDYEYFLSRFAASENIRGGEVFTPRTVVNALVEMIRPSNGTVYDPCCGSGGMFIETRNFIEKNNLETRQITFIGQERDYTTWRLAKMNLAIQGIDAELALGDSFLQGGLSPKQADYILASPPFNMSDWGADQLQDDPRWKLFGSPPANNANYAWLQHIHHHLGESGKAGVILASDSLESEQTDEAKIRRKMIEQNAVDAIVTLPGQLFYSTQTSACMWILAKDRDNQTGKQRKRDGEVLFIDARPFGYMVNGAHREFRVTDIKIITNIYHQWCSKSFDRESDGFSNYHRSVEIDEIIEKECVLSPEIYISKTETSESREEQLSKFLILNSSGMLFESIDGKEWFPEKDFIEEVIKLFELEKESDSQNQAQPENQINASSSSRTSKGNISFK